MDNKQDFSGAKITRARRQAARRVKATITPMPFMVEYDNCDRVYFQEPNKVYHGPTWREVRGTCTLSCPKFIYEFPVNAQGVRIIPRGTKCPYHDYECGGKLLFSKFNNGHTYIGFNHKLQFLRWMAAELFRKAQK